jgi:hypothetical protein
MSRVVDEAGEALYQCALCPHRTRVSSNLAKHIEARHIVSEDGFKCRFCGRVLPSRNARQSHISRHHRHIV